MAESGTHARVESLTETLERVLGKLDTLADRVADLRVEVERVAGKVDNVRGLVDGAHARADKLESGLATALARIDALETERDERRGESRRGKLVAAGIGTASGGAIAGVVELISRILSS